MSTKRGIRKLVMISFLVVVLTVLTVFVVAVARAQPATGMDQRSGPTAGMGLAFLAAAAATGFGCVGAGIAVAYVGAAAVGAVGEKPEVAGRTLIFVGLAEGVAIYGLIIAIMILGKV